MKKKIYNNLSIKSISDRELETINKSVQENYKIEGNISYFNPNYKLFTNYFNDTIGFNNGYRLVKIIKKRDRIGTIGWLSKSKIITPHKCFYHAEVFLKEIPMIPVSHAELYYLACEENNSIGPLSQQYNSFIYDTNSQPNIEVMTSYMVSKLEELKVSPHFCRFYGCYLVNMEKYTYDITDEPDKSTIIEMVADNRDVMKIYRHSGEYSYDSSGAICKDTSGNLVRDVETYLECKHYPIFILATEKSDLNIPFLYMSKLIDYNFIRSILFQIFSSIVTMYHTFGIKHNDLHNGNIMLSLTEQSHFYYRFGRRYYKVPTFGYCVKLIDFGRATYFTNSIEGKNSVFGYNSDAFGQYRYPRINGREREVLFPEDNPWTDIIMISQNLLYLLKDFRDSDAGKFLYEIITPGGQKDPLEVNKLDWDIYKIISICDWSHVSPEYLFGHKFFKQYGIGEKSIPKQTTLYTIPTEEEMAVPLDYIEPVQKKPTVSKKQVPIKNIDLTSIPNKQNAKKKTKK